MKKTKFLMPLLAGMTVVSPSIVYLSSCGNNQSIKCTITFNSEDGGSISGLSNITVYRGTKWCNVYEPDYIQNDKYVFKGWFNGDHQMQNTDVVTSDMTITAKFVLPTHYRNFTWYKNDKQKTATIGQYVGINPNVVIPRTYVVGDQEYEVTNINPFAFKNCLHVSSITLNDNITSIGSGAFTGCTNLTSFHLTKGVNKVGYYIFQECTQLSSITVDKKNQHFFDNCGSNSINHKIFKSLFAGCKNTTIPNDGSVVSIAPAAFKSCNDLSSITIPDNIHTICDAAFENCTKLESIYVPAKFYGIGKKAFYNCTNLSFVSFANDDDLLFGDYAFANCKSLCAIDVSRITDDTIPQLWLKMEHIFTGISSSGIILINNLQQKEMWTTFFSKWVNFDSSTANHWTIKVKYLK